MNPTTNESQGPWDTPARDSINTRRASSAYQAYIGASPSPSPFPDTEPNYRKKKEISIPPRCESSDVKIDFGLLPLLSKIFSTAAEAKSYVESFSTKDKRKMRFITIDMTPSFSPISNIIPTATLYYRDGRSIPDLKDLGAKKAAWEKYKNEVITACLERCRYTIHSLTSTPDEFTPIREFNARVPDTLKSNLYCGICNCGIRSSDTDSFDVSRNYIVCRSCVSHSCVRCKDCNHIVSKEHGIHDRQARFHCNACKETAGLWTCDGCGLHFLADDCRNVIEGATVCTVCVEEEANDENIMPFFNLQQSPDDIGRRYPHRDFSPRKFRKLCSSTPGGIVQSTRIFGVEIECCAPSELAIQRLSSAAPKVLGIGTDGSISGAHGIEIRTPKLGGKMGETFITELSSYLVKNKFTTNASCGLHIHLDGGKDFISKNQTATPQLNTHTKFLLMFYWIFEDVLQSFLPVTRRENKYCRSIKRAFSFQNVMNARTLYDIEKIWYGASAKHEVDRHKSIERHASRYYGANLHTLLSDNHLEIRYHSGTIRAERILQWIHLHAAIMDRIAAGQITYDQLSSVSHLLDMEEKTEAFCNLLNLSRSAKEYFLSRQRKFKVEHKLTEEALTL